jgi:hypothetical protein
MVNGELRFIGRRQEFAADGTFTEAVKGEL